eukprot:10452714-Alexandrium_andersonii.AAC.1
MPLPTFTFYRARLARLPIRLRGICERRNEWRRKVEKVDADGAQGRWARWTRRMGKVDIEGGGQ